ncbi:MAG: protein phosphatase 2C domain-containing protein [Thermoguttaceae bacterium]
MPFQWRAFELAKEPEHPDQNQDAWWLNAQAGIAAIADGVTSGIFSRQWARLLTREAVENWPEPGDSDRFAAWLAGLRSRWEREIDVSGLAWYQRAKLREGGFATLLWLRLLDNDGLLEGGGRSRLEAMAIGDTCLFHVRDDRLLDSFPLDTSGQFDSSPLVLGSVDLKRDNQLHFERLEAEIAEGDTLVLCTDAVAAWAVSRYEQGQPVPWSGYWDMAPETWADEVDRLRAESSMRVDDATILLLRVSQTAGPTVEEYVPAAIRSVEGASAADPPDVDLLAVDDWGVPADSVECQPGTTAIGGPAAWSPASAEIYPLQTSAPSAGAQAAPASPPASVPVGPPAPLPSPPAPPPLPAGQPPQRPPADWRDQVNDFSERLFKKVSEKLSRGVDKLQEAKEAAVKKLREKTDGNRQDHE